MELVVFFVALLFWCFRYFLLEGLLFVDFSAGWNKVVICDAMYLDKWLITSFVGKIQNLTFLHFWTGKNTLQSQTWGLVVRNVFSGQSPWKNKTLEINCITKCEPQPIPNNETILCEEWGMIG